MQLHSALMWFDNSRGVAFDDKVSDAAEAYEDKFGRSAEICYVNPNDLPEGLTPPLGLAVEPEPTVLRHHFYIGLAGSAR